MSKMPLKKSVCINRKLVRPRKMHYQGETCTATRQKKITKQDIGKIDTFLFFANCSTAEKEVSYPLGPSACPVFLETDGWKWRPRRWAQREREKEEEEEEECALCTEIQVRQMRRGKGIFVDP